METAELARLEGFETAVQGQARVVESVYCADLLSWAMGRAPAGCAWCTVMGNVNAVAVASLADVAALVLCEGARLDEEAHSRAEAEGIPVFLTHLPAFEAGLHIARAAGLLER
ncbi:hypothetical protein LJC49_08855 [Ruminococcaceae bacterium OttesenSCG-928-I18]|nr:hypothetical protein [Ruminococcaceae bacterium OttesenSCG-928-I18]